MIDVWNQEYINYTIKNSGNYRISLNSSECKVFNLLIEANKKAEILIEIVGDYADINARINALENANVNIIFWNKVSKKLNFTSIINLSKDAFLHYGVGDLSSCRSSYSIKSSFVETGASFRLTSSILAGIKDFVIKMDHKEKYTFSDIQNFAIVGEKGKLTMDIIGKIRKGSIQCNAHQSTKVLTLSKKQISRVLPVLEIDECDVKASHGATIGQLDEAQLYYLQSRGLTKEQALTLLTKGYLLPICDVFVYEEFSQYIKNEIENKVICYA